MRLAHRTVGPGQPVFLVAELSANHAQSLTKAHRLIDMAAKAGADAIKIQLYRPDELAARRGGGEAPAPWSGSLLDLYRQGATPWEWTDELFAHARELGLVAFGSAFSVEAVEYLKAHCSAAIKISAYESEDDEICAAAQHSGLPVIASLSGYGTGLRCSDNLALLHCVSRYPSPCASMLLSHGLRRVRFMVEVCGLSDHSVCITTAQLAVALGASIIEVHVMLDDSEYDSPPLDHRHSWRPGGFVCLVAGIRHAEETLYGSR